MREIRTSGSEGGAGRKPRSYLYQGGMNRKGAEVAKGRRKYMEETPVTWVASTLVSELRERF